jgi:hypothetical protein
MGGEHSIALFAELDEISRVEKGFCCSVAFEELSTVEMELCEGFVGCWVIKSAKLSLRAILAELPKPMVKSYQS